MTTVSITKMRTQVRKLADQVAHHSERICIERNGEPAFVMVPIRDMEILEALEDKADVKAARKALKTGKFTPLSKVKKDLGI